jgi:glycosyltransferase involved in cell wall biosynthesis
MSVGRTYNLVHITTSGEYKTPLVASQLFDQAEFQAVIKEGFAPQKVEAWIIDAMRAYFDNESKNKLEVLRKRCPHVNIRMVNGISRLNNFPLMFLMGVNRARLGKQIPVIYHCRGESAAKWALQLRSKYPGDKVVLDVRGYWPAELLYNRGIDDPALAEGQDLRDYNKANELLKATISKVDGVTTVSSALKELLVEEIGAPKDTTVVPCCVNQVTGDERRIELRKSWGLKEDEIALVYSGSTAAYQHLDDLTIPFLKKLAERNSKIRLVFLSSELDKIRGMLVTAGIATDKVILKGFPQNEVASALTACDAGILIRKPTLVNRVANPVKIAEYMAAGLPIIIEKGVGGVSETLFERSLLKSVEIAAPCADMDIWAAGVNEWLESGLQERRQQVRDYVKDVYLWSSATQVSRKMYLDVLK